MAIKNDFVVKHGLTVTNTATINQDLIVVGSIKKNGVDVGYGYTGSQGSIGYTGSQGIQGVTGYTGSQGIQGNIGYTGSQGNIGYTGSQGAQGIAGYTGSQGVIGYTGSKGDSGLGFTIAKTYASVAALTADTNPTGIVAGQFALIETGDVENPENSRLYLWNGSAYTYVSDLSGAQGITGPQGVIGYTGSQGVIGYTGSQGTQGVIGYTGSQGVIGYTGSQGTQGVIGYTGSAGPSNVLNATATSTSSVQYIIGVPVTGSNQTPNASTTVPVVFQPSTGNVGIGVTPSVPLEVRKSATGSNVIQRVGISGQTKNPYLEQKFDETNGLVTLNASGSSTPAFTFEIAQAEKMRIDTSGNVGVGTSNPFNASGYGSLTLNGPTGSITSYQVNGTEKFRIQAMADSTSINSFGTNPLTIYTNNAERMRIGANGDVGIGTGVPGAKLQVVGSSTVAGYNNVAAVFGAGVSSELYVGSLNGTAPFIASGNAYPLLFQTNGSERMRIDANGNVGIGSDNPTGWNSKFLVAASSGYIQSAVLSVGSTGSDIATHVVAASGGNYNVTTQAYGDGFVQVHLNGAAGKDRRTVISSNDDWRWLYGADSIIESGNNTGSNFVLLRFADNGEYLGTALSIYRNSGEVYFGGSISPNVDNTKSNGAAYTRWSTVYAGTGTINTSDAREKNEVRSLTENEILAAQALSKEIGAYKFLKSIEEKGDAAREHIGMTVQRAIAVMESFGLNPFNYGFICYDEWDQETETIPATEAVDAVLDEAGNVVTPAVEAKPEEIKVIREAGNRYSFRMDELSMFIARGVVARLESVEARLSALEG